MHSTSAALASSCSAPTPWLTLIGVGEAGAAGLSAAARRLLRQADVVFGSPRQLVVLGLGLSERVRLWPVPLDVAPLLAERGRRVVALASGDPFHFGVGATLTARLAPHEWRCVDTSASAFSMMAARLGWALQDVACLGLHAAPLERLLPYLSAGQRVSILLRDAAAIDNLANYLKENGFGASKIYLFAALGGQRELSAQYPDADFMAQVLKIQENPDARLNHYLPVCAAVEMAQSQDNLAVHFPMSAGRSLDWFENDGQITKPPIRALTLAALAPTRGQRLWDLGAGSGSVALEWCAASGGVALCVEKNAERAERIGRNAARWGLKKAQLQTLHADWGDVLNGSSSETEKMPPDPRVPHWSILGQVGPIWAPDAIFIGGGLSKDNWAKLLPHIPKNCRVVINAVTLENQALVLEFHQSLGGQLFKFDYSQPETIGGFQIWKSAATIMQWVWQK